MESICKDCECLMEIELISSSFECCTLVSFIDTMLVKKCTHFKPKEKPNRTSKEITDRTDKALPIDGKKRRVYKGNKGGFPKKEKDFHYDSKLVA